MPFTIPNHADAFHAFQASPDSVDFDILTAAFQGEGVVAGCAVTSNSNMTLAVASGVVAVDGARATVTGANVTVGTADTSNARIDLVTVNSSGTLAVTAGTAAAVPQLPDIPSTSVVLAAVYIPVDDTVLATNQITDKRVFINNAAAPGLADDNILVLLGTDGDAAIVLNSAGLAADAELTGVIEGTSDTLAVAANSLLFGNVTNDGDVAIYVSKAGNSHMAFLADGSTGDTILMAASGQSVDMYIAGTKEMDFTASGIDLVTGNDYQINSTSVLNATTLGSAVVNSSLTSFGVLASPVMTTPQINDTSADHQYIFAGSELAADRTVTLPLLTGNDTFVFEAHAQTFTNKTFDANGTGNVLSNVDIADLAAGTDGELITWDAAGVAATVAVGTATHVLTSNGAGVAPTFQVAAATGLVRIGTVEASDSASLTITGLDSTYDTYYIEISGCVPASDNVALLFRMGDSGGIDSGATDYEYHIGDVVSSSAAYAAAASTGAAEIRISAGGVGSAAGEGVGASLILLRPGDSSMRPLITGSSSRTDNGGVLKGGNIIGERSAVITLTQVQILFASGNITSGRLTVWGSVHA